MARLNQVELMGTVKNIKLLVLGKDKTNMDEAQIVLNFVLRYYNQELERYINLPISVWEEKVRMQCVNHLKEGDVVFIKGEIRNKYVYDTDTEGSENKKEKKLVKIYTSVKASEIEFISKKIHDTKIEISAESFRQKGKNRVLLMGNVVSETIDGKEEIVVAVDRLNSIKNAKLSNHLTTDFITMLLDKETKITGKMQKGSVVMIEGELLTRKREEGKVIPTIVVGAKDIITG